VTRASKATRGSCGRGSRASSKVGRRAHSGSSLGNLIHYCMITVPCPRAAHFSGLCRSRHSRPTQPSDPARYRQNSALNETLPIQILPCTPPCFRCFCSRLSTYHDKVWLHAKLPDRILHLQHAIGVELALSCRRRRGAAPCHHRHRDGLQGKEKENE